MPRINRTGPVYDLITNAVRNRDRNRTNATKDAIARRYEEAMIGLQLGEFWERKARTYRTVARADHRPTGRPEL